MKSDEIMPPIDSDPPEAAYYLCSESQCNEERSYEPYQLMWVPGWDGWYCENCVEYHDVVVTGIQLSKWLELRNNRAQEGTTQVNESDGE